MNVEKPTFKKICKMYIQQLTNFPYIEKDFDALTDYGLLCKIVDYLNQVIENNNTQNESITNLYNAFVKLKDYVDNYFENLDVQEEINNKLEEMVETGELQEIIAEFLNSKAIFAFDTITEMKESTNLISGSYVRTNGYYAINDGGGAYYSITDTEPESYYETLESGLYAQMIFINESITVKQFGAYGDNSHDDTSAFNTALSIGKKLIVPKSTYLVDYLNIVDNSTIDGCDSIINTAIPSTNLNKIGSNVILKNITINSTNTNREWNRVDITNQNNIIIDNCKFSGFRQITESGPNVWALYFKNSTNIRVTNILFDNNSFEDILIENGCQNLYFNNIKQVNGGANVDIEPSTNQDLENILFENCILNVFHTTDYQYTGNNTNNITCINCTISNFAYHGSDLTLINCKMSKHDGLIISDTMFGGPLKMINSASFGTNLIKDPYFNDVAKTSSKTSYWDVSYSSQTWNNLVKHLEDEDGKLLAINYNNLSGNAIVETPKIDIVGGAYYMLSTMMKSNYPASGTNQVSTCCKLIFYNDQDEQLSPVYTCSLDRHAIGTISKLSEQNLLFKTPNSAVKIKIQYRNGPSSTQSIYLKQCGLYRISSNLDGDSNNKEELPEQKKRIMYKSTLPTSNYINYSIGDIIYYEEPSTFIGAVCTNEETQGGTWSDFGAISQ